LALNNLKVKKLMMTKMIKMPIYFACSNNKMIQVGHGAGVSQNIFQPAAACIQRGRRDSTRIHQREFQDWALNMQVMESAEMGE